MSTAIKFINYRVKKMSIELNEVTTDTSFSMSPKISCQIKHAPQADTICTMRLDIQTDADKLTTPFNISVEIEGRFKTDEGIDQKEAAKSMSEFLFPYIRAAVSMMTSQCNIPQYVLPVVDFAAANSGTPNAQPPVGGKVLLS